MRCHECGVDYYHLAANERWAASFCSEKCYLDHEYRVYDEALAKHGMIKNTGEEYNA